MARNKEFEENLRARVAVYVGGSSEEEIDAVTTALAFNVSMVEPLELAGYDDYVYTLTPDGILKLNSDLKLVAKTGAEKVPLPMGRIAADVTGVYVVGAKELVVYDHLLREVLARREMAAIRQEAEKVKIKRRRAELLSPG